MNQATIQTGWFGILMIYTIGRLHGYSGLFGLILQTVLVGFFGYIVIRIYFKNFQKKKLKERVKDEKQKKAF